MLTLAINTASSTEALAVFDERRVRAEMTWKGKMDESKKLLPNILAALKKARCTMKDIRRIIVVSGPGPFSALRIGVTTANVLAYMYRIPLFEIDTPTYFWHRLPNDDGARARGNNFTLLLHAGGNFVYKSSKKGKDEIIEINKATLPSTHYSLLTTHYFGDITSDQKQILRKANCTFIDEKKLKTLGETLQQLPHAALKKVSSVTPHYFRPPNITRPS